MARDLTIEELAILQTHAAAGDRIAYYTAMQSFDNDYAGLALGVVNNDAAAGKTANIGTEL